MSEEKHVAMGIPLAIENLSIKRERDRIAKEVSKLKEVEVDESNPNDYQWKQGRYDALQDVLSIIKGEK